MWTMKEIGKFRSSLQTMCFWKRRIVRRGNWDCFYCSKVILCIFVRTKQRYSKKVIDPKRIIKFQYKIETVMETIYRNIIICIQCVVCMRWFDAIFTFRYLMTTIFALKRIKIEAWIEYFFFWDYRTRFTCSKYVLVYCCSSTLHFYQYDVLFTVFFMI